MIVLYMTLLGSSLRLNLQTRSPMYRSIIFVRRAFSRLGRNPRMFEVPRMFTTCVDVSCVGRAPKTNR